MSGLGLRGTEKVRVGFGESWEPLAERTGRNGRHLSAGSGHGLGASLPTLLRGVQCVLAWRAGAFGFRCGEKV